MTRTKSSAKRRTVAKRVLPKTTSSVISRVSTTATQVAVDCLVPVSSANTVPLGRWDDWVPQDRLRKLTDENKELARNLREEAQSFQRSKDKAQKAPPFTGKKRGVDSVRESEERQSSVAAPNQPRGKRARDVETEKVRAVSVLLLSSSSLLQRS
jgi:hypothetical protein